MKIYKIEPQDNEHFSIIYNKELDCYDMVLKKAKYDTSAELLGILSFVHQMGVNCDGKLRIGARMEQDTGIIKPKIILQ